jgi:hypothetical protein
MMIHLRRLDSGCIPGGPRGRGSPLRRQPPEPTNFFDQLRSVADALSLKRWRQTATQREEEHPKREPANAGGNGNEDERYRYCCDYFHSPFQASMLSRAIAIPVNWGSEIGTYHGVVCDIENDSGAVVGEVGPLIQGAYWIRTKLIA